jgi:hypothetical protein
MRCAAAEGARDRQLVIELRADADQRVRCSARTELDSIPAEINARLPAIRPTPSLRITNKLAAAIDASVIRRCTATCSLLWGSTIGRA